MPEKKSSQPETFQCPACGAPLELPKDAASIQCPYCHHVVIVPESLRTASSLSTHEPDVPDTARIQEIIVIARSGNKIEAIKQYRELTGVGLKEAKDAVEALMAGRPVEITVKKGDQISVGEDISELVRSGRKIDAIKLYREQTGLGLKESKEAIEAIEAAQKWGNLLTDEGDIQKHSPFPTPAPIINEYQPSRMEGCITKAAVVIVALAILLGCLTPVLIQLFDRK